MNVNEKTWSRVILSVPPGMEVACMRTARRELGVKFEMLSSGLIISLLKEAGPAIDRIAKNAPIWTFGAFRLVVKMQKQQLVQSVVVAALRRISDNEEFSGKSYWLTTPSKPSRAIDVLRRSLLKEDIGLFNNPTNYQCTLRIAETNEEVMVLLGHSISVKQRFSYRTGDVGASINPVLAACLVRLIPASLDGRCIDPTCGSGTLLFERLRYSCEELGLGIDVSSTAQSVFDNNLAALGMSDKTISFTKGDAANPRLWQPCTSVIGNLPFGIRIRQDPLELRTMYKSILANSLSTISEDGRILFTSSFKAGLDYAIKSQKISVKILGRYRCEMGGLFYQTVVLAKS